MPASIDRDVVTASAVELTVAIAELATTPLAAAAVRLDRALGHVLDILVDDLDRYAASDGYGIACQAIAQTVASYGTDPALPPSVGDHLDRAWDLLLAA